MDVHKGTFFEADANLDVLSDDTIAVVGYGTQGQARALNMRDSGLQVIVGADEGSEDWSRAAADGLPVSSIEAAARRATIFEVQVPDMAYRAAHVYKEGITPFAAERHMVCFSSGFNFYYGHVKPDPGVDAVITAAKGPGAAVRDQYLIGKGVPALLGIHQDASGEAWQRGLALCKGIGFTRAGVQETSTEEETCTDLLGEHCAWGAIVSLLIAVFEVMVEAGYDANVAFYEAVSESKLTTDLIYRFGMAGMLERISNTAAFGAMRIGPRIIDAHVKDNIRWALKNIQDGGFDEDWSNDYAQGYPEYRRLLEEVRSHPAELVGAQLRDQMGVVEPGTSSVTNTLK